MEILAYLMGFFYIVAGANHFYNPYFYEKMIKTFLPFPKEVVYLSGLIEILLGIGMFFEITREVAATGIILLLIAIFPANLNMAMHPENWKYSPFLLYLRLPMQAIFIYLAWLFV